MTYAELINTQEVDYDHLERIESRLIETGKNRPLVRDTGYSEWERYWQNIADAYIAAHPDTR